MMVSMHNGEVVAVSVVEEDVDPGTNFLAAACRSRSADGRLGRNDAQRWPSPR
jgi:hypothetical protein